MNKIFHHKTTNLGLIALSICGAIALSLPLGLTVNPVFAQGEIQTNEAKKAATDRLFNEIDKLFDQGTAYELGQYEKALKYYQQSLIIYQQIKDRC